MWGFSAAHQGLTWADIILGQHKRSFIYSFSFSALKEPPAGREIRCKEKYQVPETQERGDEPARDQRSMGLGP